MKTKRQALQAMREAVRQGPDRSTLYWWMIDHHFDLVEAGAAGRMPWQRLCKDFIAEGLTDGRGKPPTPARAGKTWREACTAVEALANGRSATAQNLVSQAPSRQHPDWQPTLAAPQRRPEPRTPPPRQPATETLPRAGPVEGTGNADAKLAAAKRQFAWMDRHIVQQSEED